MDKSRIIDGIPSLETMVYLGDQLHVEGAGHAEGGGNCLRHHFDFRQSLRVDILRRGHQSGVARVNARVLHVFRHGHAKDNPVKRDRVHVYLFRLEDEL